jgi:hypothetical protein
MNARNSLPSQDPLTPADCDLRRTPAMPIDIARLFGSDFYALSTGAEFKAAVTLWCKSFQQLPAASLPADEALLAHLSGAGEYWAAVRAGWRCAAGSSAVTAASTTSWSRKWR